MIRISKGLDLPISGSPSLNISDEPKVSNVGLLSNDFVGMKPTIFFKEGIQLLFHAVVFALLMYFGTTMVFDPFLNTQLN